MGEISKINKKLINKKYIYKTKNVKKSGLQLLKRSKRSEWFKKSLEFLMQKLSQTKTNQKSKIS